MNAAPKVTVLIPARNEQADIGRCLAAVVAQDYPHDRMEVVLVDGASGDATASIGRRILGRSDIDWKLIENSAGTTPSSLNAGLAVASGELLCRVDARSVVPPEYVRRCSEVLSCQNDVVVTGGAQVTLARDSSARSVGIARALNNRFAMGGSRYRSGRTSGESDTVYLGAFRTQQLRDIGGWNEYFETNQDYELNRRLARLGTVWFDARLAVGYLPRRDVQALWRQYHRFGRWKVRYWRRTGDRPRVRQALSLGAVPSGVLMVAMLVGRCRGRRRMMALTGLIGCGLVIEGAGSAGPRGGVSARIGSLAVSVVVGLAWSTGVYRELLSGRGRATSS